ncbi:T9SS type A sorting domain-containing protein [candidate division WOR-3 bacterium]|nr:T9SS type A sorting domain-containing protein [candidate division WOR-3 bacterium]
MGFSTGRGELYVGMDADYASAIDVPEDTLIGYVDYRDFYIRGLVHNPAGNEVYAMMTLVDEVKVIGPDYRTLAAIPVPITTGAFPLLNAALNRLYIADHDRLHVVDGNAHRLLRTLSLSDLDDPVVLLYPGTNRLYLFPIESGDAVYIYDCLADSVVAVVSVGDEMNCAAYQPLTNRFYCARYVSGDSVICVIDPVTNAVVGRLSAGPRGRRSRMFCHPENGRLYFCNRANNHLYIFDCRTNVLLDSFASVSYLDSLLWNREYNKLYICGRYQTVVLDCNTNTPVASLPYGLYRGGLMNERSGKLYLGRNVIDCRSDSLVATLTEVGTPYNFTWSPIDNRVFVSCRNSYIAVYQDEPVGIAEGDDLVLLRLAIASNPVRGQALLRCQVPPGQAVTLSVVDILGRVVLHSSFVIRTSSFPLDLRSMRAGVYFARLEAGSQRSIAKFVLQR